MPTRVETPSFENPDSIRLTPEQLVEPVLRLMTLAKENVGEIPEFQEVLRQKENFLETHRLGSNKVWFETPDSQIVVQREQYGGWIFAKQEVLLVAKKRETTGDYGMAVLLLDRDRRGQIRRGRAYFVLGYNTINKRRYENTNETLEKIENFLKNLVKPAEKPILE